MTQTRGAVGSAACTGEGLTNFATQDTALYGPNAPLFSLWYDPQETRLRVYNMLSHILYCIPSNILYCYPCCCGGWLHVQAQTCTRKVVCPLKSNSRAAAKRNVPSHALMKALYHLNLFHQMHHLLTCSEEGVPTPFHGNEKLLFLRNSKVKGEKWRSFMHLAHCRIRVVPCSWCMRHRVI